MEQQLAPVLGRLHKLLEEASTALDVPVSFALIGGLAISTWGAVRATQDIDLLADSEPSPIGDRHLRDALARFLEKQKCLTEWRIGSADDPIPLLLRLEIPGSRRTVAVDILWAYRRWHQQALRRRIKIPLGKFRVFVLHPEDLILLKLDAGGPQDLLDVQSLLEARPPELDIRRLKRIAARLRLDKTLSRCLPTKRR